MKGYRFTGPPESVEEGDGGSVGGEVRTGDRPTFVAASVVPSLRLREWKLTWPGERAVVLDVDMDLGRDRAEGWVVVAQVWHGGEGSWRET